MTDPVQRLAREVARNLGDGPGAVRRERQRAAVARLTRAPRSRAHAGRWLVPLAAAVLLAMFLARPATVSAPLTVTVAQQAVMVGAWLAAPEREALVLDFPDDSRAELAARAGARLTRAEPGRVELALERGVLTLHVTPVPGRVWAVTAGPFTVALTDADVTATWSSETGFLSVEVHRGSVDVTDAAGTTQLRAGQRLGLRDPAANGDLLTRRESLPPADPTPVAAAPAANHSATTPDPTPTRPPASPRASAPLAGAAATSRSTTRAAESPTWLALAESGDCNAALAGAARLGLSQLHRTLAVGDLDLLAHCARVTGEAARAREALLALRRRFPADPRARTAAFLLGRIALDLDHDPPRAADWFKKYLSEAPDGALAADARRRLDELDARR
ncbi:tetratricopeptide repeat protein [Nannocystis pusilla]|uniref:tetratricopeptide repeat protein n=1 Tax=Nannocystis pusilla TaxID=889268 RepID=UPI003DA2CEA0